MNCADSAQNLECDACRKCFPVADLRLIGVIQVCIDCYPQARLFMHNTEARDAEIERITDVSYEDGSPLDF